MPGDDNPLACRRILRTWRQHPHFDFEPPYEAFGPILAELAGDPAAARLVDGAIVRIGRGDNPVSIRSWMQAFARRRGIALPAGVEHFLAHPARDD